MVEQEAIQNAVSEVWAQAVLFTRERSPGSFDQWFAGVQFDSLTEGVLSLRARDEFVREWVDDHFLPTLTDFIRGKTGWSVQTAWTIDAELASPVSGVSNLEADTAMRDGIRPRPL